MSKMCPYCFVERPGQRLKYIHNYDDRLGNKKICMHSRFVELGRPSRSVKKLKWCHSTRNFYTHIREYHKGSHKAIYTFYAKFYDEKHKCFVCKSCSFTTTDFTLFKSHRHKKCYNCGEEFMTRPCDALRDHINRCRSLSTKGTQHQRQIQISQKSTTNEVVTDDQLRPINGTIYASYLQYISHRAAINTGKVDWMRQRNSFEIMTWYLA